MAIASINGQVLETFGKTRLVDKVIAPDIAPSDMDAAEIAQPQKSLLHVALAEKATMKGLAAAILAAFDTDLD
ncbi:hypothetical protein EN850_12690 [Mesorhizobium sp. M8A.F.Ca.ET.207.01.1.1]|uniref:hypothetical protein n=1 Tax=Mesorhizobium sp. M8A.F.Ca.ET.207.01.1.1 TaxID=2563968 RepID=UPI00109CCBCD|nr:hypothetical protein [Mesorhizobium sp. M8A.F.Ca.ET.207.01.1.1]TGQ80145.1 hypothetical protein EN850_12690 [Mesorhizobium sp. M8A.F.Ca.ET.207.01.1.1]